MGPMALFFFVIMSKRNVVTRNKKARRDYFIDDVFEAGMVLKGTEVKSLRNGSASIDQSYAGEKQDELYLFGAYIAEYDEASVRQQHEPTRPRKLLLKRREIDKILGTLRTTDYTLIPLKIYFNSRGYAKVQIGLAKGKKKHDKRETIKKRDWERKKGRLIRDLG
jgi:SsrA-binding protein